MKPSLFLALLSATTLATAADPLTFEEASLGEEPEGLLVIDGEWTVVESSDGGQVLQLAPFPLVEGGFVFGENAENGGRVAAKVKADKKRRSYPRFGIGLQGLSGYRLRIVPSADQLELVKSEDVVKTEPFAWKAGEWCHVELTVAGGEAGPWKVEGRVWAEGSDRPVDPQISLESDEKPGKGKPSVWGTAYAGLPIMFDDLEASGPDQ